MAVMVKGIFAFIILDLKKLSIMITKILYAKTSA